MPASYTSQQRTKIQQFSSFTASGERNAVKFLKAHDWNVEQAVHSFLSLQGGSGGSSTASTTALNKIFDKYRDNPIESPDTIGVEGSMRYLADLKVQLDDVAVLVVGEALQSPTMGEFTRQGFVDGWKALSTDSISKQAQVIAKLAESLASNPPLFRRVYRRTFDLARNAGQKAVALDAAIEYWRLLFSERSGVRWATPNSPWLEWWVIFLGERWKKSVNRDMWNMTYEFFARSMQDESLAWWDDQGAWPSVIDDFVLWVREKREGGDSPAKMEVE
ncbi:MAG: hypothetical protein M1825_002000 [Sarcosagium campestre]|nr:MAG: hypothetical protein M1825_002000 [Sarcosagium campestre]